LSGDYKNTDFEFVNPFSPEILSSLGSFIDYLKIFYAAIILGPRYVPPFLLLLIPKVEFEAL
jgi:hypothetical protein